MAEQIFPEGKGGGTVKQRPRLQIPWTRVEVFCELAAAAVILGMLIYFWTAWSTLPARIPVHFNFSGQADRWGDRGSLLGMFAVMAALYTGLSVLQRFPHIYNYPFGLTSQNARRQYLAARQLLTFIKFEIVCVFSFIGWRMLQVARSESPYLGAWFIPVLALCLFATLAWYFVAASRAK
jgi:hypothetical protein